MNCRNCGVHYTKEELKKLKTVAHNIIYDFDIFQCANCGFDIAPISEIQEIDHLAKIARENDLTPATALCVEKKEKWKKRMEGQA
jgi:hypothetical protein